MYYSYWRACIIRRDGARPVSTYSNSIMSVYIRNLCTFAAKIHSMTDNIGTFIETYNYLHLDGNDYMTEFGFFWMPSRRVQLDISCDLDFQNLGKYYAIGCGVAWMIN